MKQPIIIFPEISASTFPDDADNWVALEGITSNAKQRWSLWLAAPRYRFRIDSETGCPVIECCPPPGLEQLKLYSQPEEAVADVYLKAGSHEGHPQTFFYDPSRQLFHAVGDEFDVRFGEVEPRECAGEERFLYECSTISNWDQESVGSWYDAACFILFCECLLGTLGLQVSDKVTTAIYRRERVLAQVAITQMKWVFDQPTVEYS